MLRGGRARARREGLARRSAALMVLFVILVAGIVTYGEIAAGAPAIGCTGVGHSAPTSDSSSINIGYLTELSGIGVSNGYAARIGAELAFNQTNANGGIDGKMINLEVLDDQTSPSVAVQCATMLDQDDGVLAITGPTDQADAVAVQSYAEAHGVPFVVSTVPSATLAPPGSKWTVSVQPDSVQWGAAVAKYISETVPGAKLALMTENGQVEKEMAAGVNWYASTYKNESVVFNQLYANAQFPWATAASAAKLSGANAVVISWIPSVGFSESNVVAALESAGFTADQIFVASASDQITDLGVSGAGIRGATVFDTAMAKGYPNATTFVNMITPYTNGELYPKTYCGVCPTDVGPIYYYSYLGAEMMIKAIQDVLSSGQPLTRANFMSSLKSLSVEDAFGNTLSFDSSGAAVGTYYVVACGALNSTAITYPFVVLKTVRFAPGTVPAYELAKSA